MVRKMVEKKMLLIGELTQGRELAAQLNQLDPVESREACQALVEKIVSTYDKALSMLNLRGMKREADLTGTFQQTLNGHTKDQDFPKEVSKKRKKMPKLNEEMSVSVCTGDGGEDSPKEDGHRWRKYGQKEILGAKFPRAYYRCTHRKTQGCFATKKIQKSDNDSSIFQISYKGRHTCIHDSNFNSSSASIDIPIPISISKTTKKMEIEISKLNTDHQAAPTPLETLRNLQQGLKVDTENMNSYKQEIFDLDLDLDFDFDFSSVSPFITQPAENVEIFNRVDYSTSLPPVFLSPSNFIQFDWQGNSNEYGFYNNGVLQNSVSDSDLTTVTTEMELTPTSGFESPFTDLDFDTTAFLNESLGYFS